MAVTSDDTNQDRFQDGAGTLPPTVTNVCRDEFEWPWWDFLRVLRDFAGTDFPKRLVRRKKSKCRLGGSRLGWCAPVRDVEEDWNGGRGFAPLSDEVFRRGSHRGPASHSRGRQGRPTVPPSVDLHSLCTHSPCWHKLRSAPRPGRHSIEKATKFCTLQLLGSRSIHRRVWTRQILCFARSNRRGTISLRVPPRKECVSNFRSVDCRGQRPLHQSISHEWRTEPEHERGTTNAENLYSLRSGQVQTSTVSLINTAKMPVLRAVLQRFPSFLHIAIAFFAIYGERYAPLAFTCFIWLMHAALLNANLRWDGTQISYILAC